MNFKKYKWHISFGLSLLLISVLLFDLHYIIFNDTYNLYFYLLHGIALIPIQVIIVGLILDGILERKEKEKVRKKLNMVVGLFFSELGNDFIKIVSQHDSNLKTAMSEFEIKEEFKITDLYAIKEKLNHYKGKLELDIDSLNEIKDLLKRKKDFMIKLIQNPVLLEHDIFTELLMATYHISEEFGYREEVNLLPKRDLEHLSGDVARAYNYIVIEWIVYMIYLKKQYPYLFKSAIMTNPFINSSEQEYTN